MAAGRIKGITIEIGGDTSKLTKALASVDNAISNTQKNLRDIDKALKLDPTNVNLLKDKQQELATEISNTEKKLETEKQALEQMKNTEGFDKNSQAARNLQTQIDLDTAALKQLKDEAKASSSVVGTVFQEAGKKISEVGDKVKEVGENIKDVGNNLTQKVTVPIVAAFGTSVKEAIEWESAFTGVMKTVDETSNTTYDDLKDSINEIAKTTASSQNTIAATMEIAGQLGVSADNITEFTKTMVMLGDTTNLSSEEAASAIAKFANVTKMPLSDVENLGSVIVDLGNNYATTEADIMSMATRLSGAGAQIGLTQGEILGFATALSSVGIEAEMGGSAFSKAMIKMQVAVESGTNSYEEFRKKLAEIQPEYAKLSSRDVQIWLSNDSKALKDIATETGYTKKELTELINTRANLENFADVAGMTADEFAAAYRDSAPAALQAFIQGLGDTEAKGETTIEMLQEMGFTEVRLRDTLTRLSQSGDLVTDAVARGNEAWAENSAMANEAELRYGTMESKISQLKSRLTELAVEIGEKLMPYVEKAMDFIDQLIEKWNALDPAQQEMILKIAAIAAVIGPVLVVIGSVVSAIGTIISAVGSVISVIGALLPVLAGPVGVIALIVAAVVALGVVIYKNWDEIKAWAEGVWQAFKEMVQKCVEKITDFKNGIVNKFNELKTNASNKVKEIKTNIVNGFNEMKTNAINKVLDIKTKTLDTFSNIKTGISTKIGNIKDSVVNGFKGALDFIKSLPEKALGWGKDLIDSFIQGIKDKISAVGDAISGVAEVISSFIHFSEPDVGPLKNFHTFMPDMMKEMVKGINKGIPQLETAMSNMAGSLVPTINGAGGNSTTTVNLTVYGAQGQDVRELADLIQQRINTNVCQQRAVFA